MPIEREIVVQDQVDGMNLVLFSYTVTLIGDEGQRAVPAEATDLNAARAIGQAACTGDEIVINVQLTEHS